MAQVASAQNEFRALNTTVVTVSFATGYWARTWLTETQSPFPLWLDPARRAYQAYGLQRSSLRSRSPKTLLFYAKAWLRGQRLQGNRGDPNQLGGDFIIDAAGVVRFVHFSREPVDRPDISTLLNVLHKWALHG